MMLKQTSSIIVSALLAFGATQACSSDESGTPFPSAGAGGAPAGAGGALTGGGGSTAAGTGGSSAGAGGAVAGSGGAAAGTGGATAGAGGSTAGAGGAPSQWQQVQNMFSTSCGVNNCHKEAPRAIYQSPPGGLWSVLSTPFPSDAGRKCVGSTLVVPGDVDASLLPKILTGPSNKVTCKSNGQDEMVDRMPDGCQDGGMERPCMTPAMIQTIKDWIAAGAPHT